MLLKSLAGNVRKMPHRASYRLRPCTYPLGVFDLRILLGAGQCAMVNGPHSVRSHKIGRGVRFVCWVSSGESTEAHYGSGALRRMQAD
jgi:hypothetical protein